MKAPSPHRSRWRAALLIAIGVLYVLSVPWYRPPDATPPLLFGLPRWVGVAVVCYFAAAVLNAIAWSITPVPDDIEEAEDTPDRSSL